MVACRFGFSFTHGGDLVEVAMTSDIQEWEAYPLAEVGEQTDLSEYDILRRAAAGDLLLYLWFGEKNQLLTVDGFLCGWFSVPAILIASLVSRSDEMILADKLVSVDGNEVRVFRTEWPDKFLRRAYSGDITKEVVQLKKENLRLFPGDLEQILESCDQTRQKEKLQGVEKKAKASKGKTLPGWEGILDYVNTTYQLGWSLDQLKTRKKTTNARWLNSPGGKGPGKPVQADSERIDKWIKKHSYA